MGWDWRPNEPIADKQFPQLMAAIDAADKVLKKLRGLRNKGRASDEDVDAARHARNELLSILDHGHWIVRGPNSS